MYFKQMNKNKMTTAFSIREASIENNLSIYKIYPGLSNFAFYYFTIINFLFFKIMIFANFYDLIQTNDIVKYYDQYVTTIYTLTININDKDIQLAFGKLGIFPLLICTRVDEIDLIHYVIPGKNNILTKKKLT